MVVQKSLIMIDVVILAIPYNSPHICEMLQLFKWDRVMATHVSMECMISCENLLT
jgi:hypothetical protein